MADPFFPAAAPRLAEQVRQAQGIDCFLDLDGTLAPIAPTPSDATLIPEVPALLSRLHRPPLANVSIVSGRSLAALESLFPGGDYALAGNHGLEIRFEGETLIHPDAVKARPALATVASALSASLEGMPGCWVEDKGLSLTVHFRNAPRDLLFRVRALVRAAVRAAPGGGGIAVRPGKEVLEVVPVRAGHKGTAVRWLMERRRGRGWRGRHLPVYVGDDRTDEDAFRALSASGLTVRVGAGPTAAAYYVESHEEIPRLLAWLADRVEELQASRRRG